MLRDDPRSVEGLFKRCEGFGSWPRNYSALSERPVQVHYEVSVGGVGERSFGDP